MAEMGRTSFLAFWLIASLTVTYAGIPLSLRCSSRPTMPTFSRSPGSPCLLAEPHLNIISSFAPLEPIPHDDAEDTTEIFETACNSIVILHKVHKIKDEDIEITITKKEKESKDDQLLSNHNNDYDDSDLNEINYDKSVNEKELLYHDEETVDEEEENKENLLVQDDLENHDVEKEKTPVDEYVKDKVISGEEQESGQSETVDNSSPEKNN